MADVVVSLVLRKFADAVVKEALFLSGVGEKFEWVKRELTWIQSFLKDADSKRHKDERVKCWVNDVKEVGFLIEDTLEKFLLEFGVGRDSTLKSICKLPMKMVAKHKLGTEIEKIQQRLREVSENTTKYGIQGLQDSSSVASSDLLARPFVIPDIDEMEVIGFENDMKIIVGQLNDTDVTRRYVVSIVGAGGSGKTTLAKQVYKSDVIKREFGIRIWLTISQDYNMIDILIKMLEGIGKKPDTETRPKRVEDVITELYKSLKETKYVLVLDDVWSSDLWTQLEVALPKNNNGSRVLITTRFITIAEDADATSKPYEIKALNEEDSQHLLLKTIYPNQYANTCSEDLLPLIPQITKKCGGWPIALVVMGGILSKKNPNYVIWDDVIQNINWHTDGSKCMGVLSTSYEDLPVHLKSCFMYFAFFPEDYQIKASTLIQLWVAEGFISHDVSNPMDDIAYIYLEELVQRCMVQVSSRSVGGRIKYCYIHDLLRELAIQKAREDNFLTVFSPNESQLVGGSSTRRVALNLRGDMLPLKQACNNLHSLNYFGDGIPNCKRFEMLRILNIHHDLDDDSSDVCTVHYDTKWLKNLVAVRYFGLNQNRGSQYAKCWNASKQFGGVQLSSLVVRLSDLTHMKNLQTVDIQMICRSDGKLPRSFWDNKQLRHVIFRQNCIRCDGRAKGPPSSSNLPNLLSLKGTTARQEYFDAKLPQIPHLRRLAMIMPDIKGSYDDNPYQDLECLDSLLKSHLYSLSVKNCIWNWNKTVDYNDMFSPSLLKLNLEGHFNEDPMAQIEKLPNLTVLGLKGSLEMHKNSVILITCSRGGFGRLQRLVLDLYSLEEWKIEEGTMPLLNKLQLRYECLNKVPDLQYLTNLRELNVREAKEDQKCQLEGDDQWKIKHIPSVTYDNFN